MSGRREEEQADFVDHIDEALLLLPPNDNKEDDDAHLPLFDDMDAPEFMQALQQRASTALATIVKRAPTKITTMGFIDGYDKPFPTIERNPLMWNETYGIVRIIIAILDGECLGKVDTTLLDRSTDFIACARARRAELPGECTFTPQSGVYAVKKSEHGVWWADLIANAPTISDVLKRTGRFAHLLTFFRNAWLSIFRLCAHANYTAPHEELMGALLELLLTKVLKHHGVDLLVVLTVVDHAMLYLCMRKLCPPFDVSAVATSPPIEPRLTRKTRVASYIQAAMMRVGKTLSETRALETAALICEELSKVHLIEKNLRASQGLPRHNAHVRAEEDLAAAMNDPTSILCTTLHTEAPTPMDCNPIVAAVIDRRPNAVMACKPGSFFPTHIDPIAFIFLTHAAGVALNQSVHGGRMMSSTKRQLEMILLAAMRPVVMPVWDPSTLASCAPTPLRGDAPVEKAAEDDVDDESWMRLLSF